MSATRKNQESDADLADHDPRLAPALDDRDREAARRVATNAAVPHPGVYVPPVRPPAGFDDTQEMLTVRVAQDESRTAATQRNLRAPAPASGAEPLPALPVTRPPRKFWLLLAIVASVFTLVALIFIAALVGRNKEDPTLTTPSETARDNAPSPEPSTQPPAPAPPGVSRIEPNPAPRSAPTASAVESSSSSPSSASPAAPAKRAPDAHAAPASKTRRPSTSSPPPARTAPAPKRRGEEPWIPIE